MNNYSSSLFSNPFSGKGSNSNFDLNDAYAKLESLKAQQELLNQHTTQTLQQKSQRTVFSDIADEWNDLSDDEKSFIENSNDYKEAQVNYQNEFNAFLIEFLGNDFLKSSHGKSAEEFLSVLRKKKEIYKNKFASDIIEIKEQNKQLEKNNETLIQNNLELQKQLKEIQEKLGD